MACSEFRNKNSNNPAIRQEHEKWIAEKAQSTNKSKDLYKRLTEDYTTYSFHFVYSQ